LREVKRDPTRREKRRKRTVEKAAAKDDVRERGERRRMRDIKRDEKVKAKLAQNLKVARLSRKDTVA